MSEANGVGKGARGLGPHPQAASALTSPSSNTVPPPTFATAGPLPDRLRAIVVQARERRAVREVGIAVLDLGDGQGYGVSPERVFRPASVIKLAVMVGAYTGAARVPAKEFDRWRPDLRRMITISDNPSTRRLVMRLGKAPINASMRALGLSRTSLASRYTGRNVLVGSRATAGEVALLLAKLARREVVSPDASEEMLLLLGAQQKRRRIPAGIAPRPGVWIGNKTGTLPALVHDAGIVIDSNAGIAYTLAIFTEGARTEATGERLCASISAEVYRYLAGNRAMLGEPFLGRKGTP